MITYRVDASAVNSIEDFADRRIKMNADEKIVCFVRMLGAANDIGNKIEELDYKMSTAMQAGELQYFRSGELPKVLSPTDADYYSKVYEAFLNDKNKMMLKKIPMNEELGKTIAKAVDSTIDIFRKSKPSATEGIIKNFVVKLFFWLDYIGGELQGQLKPEQCIKIVAERIYKEQEYLFFYCLTQIGCDVLLLETGQDVEGTQVCKALSGVIENEPFSQVLLPAYTKAIPHTSMETGDISQEPRKLKVVIPERNRKKKQSASGEPVIQQTPARPQVVLPERRPASTDRTTVTTTGRPVSTDRGSQAADRSRRELSYEELARLASSIVMIAVHDENGEVEATGSGIMIGQNGFILTNCHVIAGGRTFSVRIEDDEEIYRTNEVIKYNQNMDLAVIRINKLIKPLPIFRGQEKLVRGQKVIAIGSPLGLFNSVSDGIISGFRNIRGEDMIQFTAPISHGSSGGAVLNMYGEVIGISTAGYDEGQNINLAMGYESIRTFARGFITE